MHWLFNVQWLKFIILPSESQHAIVSNKVAHLWATSEGLREGTGPRGRRSRLDLLPRSEFLSQPTNLTIRYGTRYEPSTNEKKNKSRKRPKTTEEQQPKAKISPCRKRKLGARPTEINNDHLKKSDRQRPAACHTSYYSTARLRKLKEVRDKNDCQLISGIITNCRHCS